MNETDCRAEIDTGTPVPSLIAKLSGLADLLSHAAAKGIVLVGAWMVMCPPWPCRMESLPQSLLLA